MKMILDHWKNEKNVNMIYDELIAEAISELHEDDMQKAYAEMDDDSIEFSQKFYRCMERLENRIHRKCVTRKSFRMALGTAICLACVLLLARPDYVVNASRSVFTWFEDHVLIEFSPKNHSIESKEVRYHMSYIPDGYTLIELNNGDGDGFAIYKNSKNECISFYYSCHDPSIYVDSEDSMCEKMIMEDGCTIYYFHATDDAQEGSVVWKSLDGLTVFTMTLDTVFEKEELIRIIQGISEER